MHCGNLMGWFFLGNRNPRPLVNTALSLQKLTLGYDRLPAVRDLEADIPQGSLTAIFGPNGAGKSTLLKGMAGTLSPLNGQLALGTLKREDIAYLPQQSDIDRAFPISVIELVAMGLWREIGSFGWLGRERRSRIERAISAVGLTGMEARLIGSLSGGQMQRALFARLLLQDVQLYLLDEPFTAIDARTMSDLIEVIHRWHGEGRTVMAVLHDQETVRAHFPDTLLLARELIAYGPTERVLTAENQFRARQMCEACEGSPHDCGKDVA